MITFENIGKSFDSTIILKNISLSIEKGETFCLLGNSGSGKTTFLKLINKLILPNEGNIYLNDLNINQIEEKKLRKNIGYVIQSGGLFPHMKISKNIALPMKLFGVDTSEINIRVNELIKQIGLDESYLERYPATLSGGQKQRVGIARAIANKPNLLLLDEPFSALDPILRDQMQNDFLEMSFLNEVTKVIVTHDLKEALKLGDRICLMGEGKILFIGTPLEFLRTDDSAVKKYIGEEAISLLISRLKFADIESSLEEVSEVPLDSAVFRITESTTIYRIMNENKTFVQNSPNDKFYRTEHIRKAFLQYIAKVL